MVKVGRKAAELERVKLQTEIQKEKSEIRWKRLENKLKMSKEGGKGGPAKKTVKPEPEPMEDDDDNVLEDLVTVKVCPWCGVGLLRLYFLYCGVVNKLTLLLVSAAPIKRKGARCEVRFPGDPATMCPLLFKGSRSLLLLACCYVTYRWS